MARNPLLLLVVASFAFVATVLPSAHGAQPSCQDLCWNAYTTEVEACINKADTSGLMTPMPPSPAEDNQGAYQEVSAQYTGPPLDVMSEVRDQCKETIGTEKLNTCLYTGCAPPPSPSPPPTCEESCKAVYGEKTVGWMRCSWNCGRRLRRHSF